MRIVHLCADPGVPVFGRKGCSVHVQEVVRAFRVLGHEVEIVASRPGGVPPADLADVAVHRIATIDHDGSDEGRERARRAEGSRSAELLDGLGPIDLVYERYSLWGSAGMSWARRRGIPGVLEVNAPLPDEQSSFRVLHDRPAADRVAVDALRAAAAVVAVSEPVRQWAVDTVADPTATSRIHVVANGVDTTRIRPTARPARPSEFTVGFVGTLKPWHGLRTLADAFVSLGDRPDVRLLVVGDGPERPSIVERLGEMVDRAEFVGAIDPCDVPNQLARMDMAVAPYPATATYFSPLKLYEYLAAGLPVVATDVAPVTDVIEHAHNGVIVPPDDPDALAAAIGELHDDPARRASLGRCARLSAEREHTWTAAVGSILGFAHVPVTTS